MDPSSPRRFAGRDGAEPDRLSNAGREGSGKRSYVRFVPRIAGARLPTSSVSPLFRTLSTGLKMEHNELRPSDGRRAHGERHCKAPAAGAAAAIYR